MSASGAQHRLKLIQGRQVRHDKSLRRRSAGLGGVGLGLGSGAQDRNGAEDSGELVSHRLGGKGGDFVDPTIMSAHGRSEPFAQDDQDGSLDRSGPAIIGQFTAGQSRRRCEDGQAGTSAAAAQGIAADFGGHAGMGDKIFQACESDGRAGQGVGAVTLIG